MSPEQRAMFWIVFVIKPGWQQHRWKILALINPVYEHPIKQRTNKKWHFAVCAGNVTVNS